MAQVRLESFQPWYEKHKLSTTKIYNRLSFHYQPVWIIKSLVVFLQLQAEHKIRLHLTTAALLRLEKQVIL